MVKEKTYIIHVEFPPAKEDRTIHMDRKELTMDVKKGDPVVMSWQLVVDDDASMASIQEFDSDMNFVQEFTLAGNPAPPALTVYFDNDPKSADDMVIVKDVKPAPNAPPFSDNLVLCPYCGVADVWLSYPNSYTIAEYKCHSCGKEWKQENAQDKPASDIPNWRTCKRRFNDDDIECKGCAGFSECMKMLG